MCLRSGKRSRACRSESGGNSDKVQGGLWPGPGALLEAKAAGWWHWLLSPVTQLVQGLGFKP